MEVSIRKATFDDYTPVCGLFDEVDALHRKNLPGLFRKPTGPVRAEDYFRGLIGDEDVGLFVAETGGELVGFVHAVVRDTPAFPILVPRRYAVVDGMGVKLGFRHRGTGHKLMDAVHAWAVAKGADSVQLNVYEFNEAAIAFYETLGYLTLSRKMSQTLKDR